MDFSESKGLCQECYLSPTLFIYVSKALVEVEAKVLWDGNRTEKAMSLYTPIRGPGDNSEW